MYNEKITVITVYGHDKIIDSIKFNSFDDEKSSRKYCDTINELELTNDSWVTARMASENTHYPSEAFLPFKFDMILSLDDISIQRVLREIDSQELAGALKGESDSIKEQIFRNMSKRAAKMLMEDIECTGAIPAAIARKSQELILSVIRHLEETREIAINYSRGETVK